MPQFAPGENKLARVPVQVVPGGLSCNLVVFLGPDENTPVVSSSQTFTSTGSQQEVDVTVTMPVTLGTYHVYLDLLIGQTKIAGYIADDVVIAAAGVTLTLGNFSIHNVNGIPFSSIGTDPPGSGMNSGPFAVLEQPIETASLGSLTVNFTYQGFQDFSDSLFCGLWWLLDPVEAAAMTAVSNYCSLWATDPELGFDQIWYDNCLIEHGYRPTDPAYVPPFYAIYTDIPYMSGAAVTKSVSISGLSNPGSGGPPVRGNWIARFGLVVLGGGPQAYFRVKGITVP